jgi:hypothetical protein
LLCRLSSSRFFFFRLPPACRSLCLGSLTRFFLSAKTRHSLLYSLLFGTFSFFFSAKPGGFFSFTPESFIFLLLPAARFRSLIPALLFSRG